MWVPESASRITTQLRVASTPASHAGSAGSGDARLLREGDRIGRYVVRRELGTGGMGRVLEAHDPQLDRRVAIKVLHRPRAGHRPLQARLLREGQALAQLSHPNVVQVYEAGRFGPDVFVAMELVDGPTLRERLADGTADWSRIVALFLDAGRGLAAAHALGLIHRDFKPVNASTPAHDRGGA